MAAAGRPRREGIRQGALSNPRRAGETEYPSLAGLPIDRGYDLAGFRASIFN
jgi:hypothetical protein